MDGFQVISVGSEKSLHEKEAEDHKSDSQYSFQLKVDKASVNVN